MGNSDKNDIGEQTVIIIVVRVTLSYIDTKKDDQSTTTVALY